MGGNFVRLLGLQIVRINYEHNIIFLNGKGIPGEMGEFVYVRDTRLPAKRFKDETPPRHFPTCFQEQWEQLPEEEYHEDLIHKFDDPSIMFTDETAKKQ